MKDQIVLCIGAALIDESYQFDNQPTEGTSNPATYYKSPGGVARNIAHHLALLDKKVELISHFDHGTDGEWLQEECTKRGIGISHSITNEINTGRYTAFLSPDGSLIFGAVSTHFETLITPKFLQSKVLLLKTASLIILDCNLSRESIQWLIHFCREEKIPCIVEPVSVAKAARLINIELSGVLLITPNADELIALNNSKKEISKNETIHHILDRGVAHLWIRKGKAGSEVYSKDYSYNLDAPKVAALDTTGAGDAALSGWVYAWLKGEKPDECIKYGHAMAALVLQVKGAIINNLTPEFLEIAINNQRK